MLPIIQYEEDNIKHLSTLNNYRLPLVTSHAEGEIKDLHFFLPITLYSDLSAS